MWQFTIDKNEVPLRNFIYVYTIDSESEFLLSSVLHDVDNPRIDLHPPTNLLMDHITPQFLVNFTDFENCTF